jgi:NAD(P)-dependent dehydrogenase (short-subunit alcohol dehydrogenase family)
MDLALTRRIAIVTGAGAGIGLAVTRALAAEGTHVIAGTRSSSPQLDTLIAGGNVAGRA